MALNTYAEAFFPATVDRAVLVLNALLGVGTALAPVLVAAVLALGAWGLLPGVGACVFGLIFVIAWEEPLRGESAAGAAAASGWRALPPPFWRFAPAVFGPRLLETLHGDRALLFP